ncbi:hypothetical protein EVAR_34152_1 [Eumeta japonica]|uniref:Uncharacterized protein n=1 Tax=Eumeta variegata TaxID=151549 RepID=A0A4C1ZVY5_EUMVA|nr:hypothetical protein EVAR_34152_1 [Eumeta japonica]
MDTGICEMFSEGLHPACWSDDVRMNALFAPFRPKAANPESWEVKEQATRLLSDHPSNLERFGTIEELMTNTKFNSTQRETFEILLG